MKISISKNPKIFPKKVSTVKKYKEKIKNEGNEYSYLLLSLQQCSYFYNDSWRSCIFSLAKDKDKKELLNKDRKIRNKMIQEEEKTKKYLIKNDFDPMKGFLAFLEELSKSMFFKLSRKHNEVEEFFDRISDETRGQNSRQNSRL